MHSAHKHTIQTQLCLSLGLCATDEYKSSVTVVNTKCPKFTIPQTGFGSLDHLGQTQISIHKQIVKHVHVIIKIPFSDLNSCYSQQLSSHRTIQFCLCTVPMNVWFQPDADHYIHSHFFTAVKSKNKYTHTKRVAGSYANFTLKWHANTQQQVQETFIPLAFDLSTTEGWKLLITPASTSQVIFCRKSPHGGGHVRKAKV